jgi:hypothetical protein
VHLIRVRVDDEGEWSKLLRLSGMVNCDRTLGEDFPCVPSWGRGHTKEALQIRVWISRIYPSCDEAAQQGGLPSWPSNGQTVDHICAD